jgi:ribosomal protein L34
VKQVGFHVRKRSKNGRHGIWRRRPQCAIQSRLK